MSETNEPDGEVLLQFDPPPDIGIGGKNVAPQSVAITRIAEPGFGGAIVWAKYGGEWHANAGGRYAIVHLLDALARKDAELQRLNDLIDSPLI